jgi:hypothetical protein
MKVATDKQVEKWKAKYGNDLHLWFANVRAGEMNITELSKLMGITAEGARKYFYRFYSNDELIGTKYNATHKKSAQPTAAVKDTKAHDPFYNPSELKNMIKSVVTEELNKFILEFTTLLIAAKEDTESDSEGTDNPLYNLCGELLKKKYNRPTFKEEGDETIIKTGVNMNDYGD